MIDRLRGHPIQETRGQWYYADTEQPTAGNRRNCALCQIPDTPEGHDPCLGTIPGVTNACCGHGDPVAAYIQLETGSHAQGMEALRAFKILKIGPTNPAGSPNQSKSDNDE